jgi:hypothetical protein
MKMSLNEADRRMVGLATAAGIASAILWLYVGWRWMRAYERMAAASEQKARASSH